MKRARWSRVAQLSAVALALVLVLGAGGYGITHGIFSDGSGSDAAHGLGAGKIPTSPTEAFVVVTTREVPAGTRIEADMVAIVEVPQEQALPFAYNHISAVVGQDAACDIGAGEQVTISDIEKPVCVGSGGSMTPTVSPTPRP